MHHTPASRRPTRALLVAYLLIIAFTVPVTLHAEAASFQVNDRIESNLSIFGWQPGIVKEIGSGDRAGQLRILTDGNANDNWVSAPAQKFIRKLAGPAPATALSTDGSQAPRPGKYLIMSYGAGSNPLHLGYFELLTGGSYSSTDMGGNATGNGRYDYDGKANEVRWMSGPFLTNKWGGKFEISRAGKTHNIQFKRGTFGTNSTD